MERTASCDLQMETRSLRIFCIPRMCCMCLPSVTPIAHSARTRCSMSRSVSQMEALGDPVIEAVEIESLIYEQ